MRAPSILFLCAAAGCYDTRLLDGHPAPVDPRDAAVAPADAAPPAHAPTPADAGSPAGDGGGACGPDGTLVDPSQPLVRCCQGKPTRVDTPDNCGACGLRCNGRDCLATHGDHYYCGCWSDDDCWSGCCTAAYGVPWVCSATHAGQPIACPGNATHSDGAPDGPPYCHY
jgi:hypothetical protein